MGTAEHKTKPWGLTNYLRAVYSILTSATFKSTERNKAPEKICQTQEVFVQQFARWFHHFREALVARCRTGKLHRGIRLPADQRHRLVAAARLAIHELDTDPQCRTIPGATLLSLVKRSGDADAAFADGSSLDRAVSVSRDQAEVGSRY